MQASDPQIIQADSLATITVCFNPDLDLLARQLAATPQHCIRVLIDNNSTKKDYLIDITNLFPGAHVIENSMNAGLGKAINQGAEYVKAHFPATRFILLLDQDSIPRQGSINRLMSAFDDISMNFKTVGAVGPLLADPVTGLNHGFHLLKGVLWKRIYPKNGATEPLSVTNLNGSGTLTELDTFIGMGGLDETLFIDHLDTEWSFRMLHTGHTLWGVPDAVFDHRMGDSSIRFWFFTWHIWPWRSPERHFYLYRNTFRLFKRGYVPFRWKFWALIKAGVTFCVYLLFDSRRWAQASRMLRGTKKAFYQ